MLKNVTPKLIRFSSGFSALLLLFTGSAFAQTFQEAPELAEQVQAGELPPIAERLPQAPMVVEPVEQVGSYGGEWRWGLVGAETPFVRIMAYENLVRWNPEWTEVIPNVAESFEASEDATTYTFRLREGMRWSDGAPFSADDIMFWFEDIFSNDELVSANPAFQPAWLTSGGEPVVVEKLDATTVVFRFNEPNGLFLQNLATPDGMAPTAFPRHYLAQFHEKYNENIGELVEGAGAADWPDFWDNRVGDIWLLSRWQDPDRPTLHAWNLTSALGEGTRTVAERNPYYWKVDPEGNQLPYLDRLVFDQVEDVEVLLLKALGGEIDMQDRHMATLANKAVFADNMAAGDYKFFDTVPADMNEMIIALNLTHKNPVKREIFRNKDFRIGLSHAINRPEIIDLVYVGQGEPHQAAPRPESEFYHEQLATQYTEYDVALANEHLDRAFPEKDAQGFRLGPDGERISFAVEVTSAYKPAQVDALELIQGYWREVGVDMQIRAQERTLLYTRKAANEHDAVVWGGDGGLNDAVLDPRWYFPYDDESNFAQAWQTWYNNPGGAGATTQPEVPPAATKRQMELYDQLRATSDPAEQRRLFMEILDIAAEEFYAIGISLPLQGYGIVKNTFHNVPEVMPSAWLYPHPAPTRPEQYFTESGGR